jgi:hypothetical protein
MTMIQTEHPFLLPVGFQDDEGTLHREGTMRLATAADEIQPLRDPRVQSNQAYLIVILLSRVITRLGSLAVVNPKTIENLYAADLAYLQDLYNRINHAEETRQQISCPHCNHSFETELPAVVGF